MKRSRYTDSQIMAILKQAEAGGVCQPSWNVNHAASNVFSC